MGPKLYAALFVLALSPLSLAPLAAKAAAIDPAMGGPGNAAHGETLFKQRCSVCHQADPGGKNGVGPELYGAYGRRAAQSPGFAYSDNLKASGLVWTPQFLNQWIQKPEALIPGAKMKIAPVSVAQDRADIIAYLATRSTNVVKVEAPAAAASANATHAAHKKAKKAS